MVSSVLSSSPLSSSDMVDHGSWPEDPLKNNNPANRGPRRSLRRGVGFSLVVADFVSVFSTTYES